MSSVMVRVEGLAELRRAFIAMGDEAKQAIREEMKAIAGIVADDAKTNLTRQGLVDSGRLLRSIRPGVSGAAAVVRANAKNKGYLYGGVYEHGGRGAGVFGPRAFLNPALDANREEVVERIGDALDDLATRVGGFR